ncbi:iron-sulfur cluster assembly scaffold protein [Candidatus Gottesmanbacteria bacterium]|nr:iron-sulfur cluster assembly scaffold protein [Candidatus Gottesmanbacteria bacterium]
MDSYYRENILDHYKNPRNFGKLNKPTAGYKLFNSACGDVISMEVKTKDLSSGGEIITDIKFQGEGCAVSMASASQLTVLAKGKKVQDILALGTEDILKLLGTTLTPSRLKCALLPLETLQKTLLQIKPGNNLKKNGT